MWRQALKKLPGSEVSYDEFIQKLVAMCEKAFDVRKVTMQSDRNFLETCWDMDTKKSRDVSFEDWIAYSVDSFVDQEKEKKVSEQDKDKEKDKDKEEVKDEAPWRRHPPPLPMPPSDGARGLCVYNIHLSVLFVLCERDAPAHGTEHCRILGWYGCRILLGWRGCREPRRKGGSGLFPH